MRDGLHVWNPKQPCWQCDGERRRRRGCWLCRGCGYRRTDLQGLWGPDSAGFLVCGGPSLRQMPLERLKERGVCSLGINNAAAYAPVKAWTFGDPRYKFHPAPFLDPGILTFAPHTQLRKCLRFKLGDTFRMSEITLADCPSTFGIPRSGQFDPETFLSTWFAHWGYGGRGDQSKQPFRRLCTTLLGFRLLHYLGVRRIYLLGVDHTREDKTDGYAWGERGSGGLGAYTKMDRMYLSLLPLFETAGLRVFNCNPESHCEAFPYCDFEQSMQDATDLIGPEPFDLRDWYASGIRKRMSEQYPDSLSRTALADLIGTDTDETTADNLGD